MATATQVIIVTIVVLVVLFLIINIRNRKEPPILEEPTKVEPTPKCEIPLMFLPGTSLPPAASVTGSPCVLVTGVSRGNGRAIATRLKQLGYYVIGTSRLAPPWSSPTFPRFKPATNPGVDVELQLDLNSPTSVNNFIVNLDAALVAAGNKSLSIIVQSAAQLALGTIAGTFAKDQGIYPYTNDPPGFPPFPAQPGIQALYDDASETSGTYQIRLLRQLLFSPPNMPLTTRVAGDARIVAIVSIASYVRPATLISTYEGGKKKWRAVIDSLRAELTVLQLPQYPNLLITTVNPTLVNTGGLNAFGFPATDPVFGDVELLPLDALYASEKNFSSAKPEHVAETVAQVVSASNPPTDVVAAPTNSFGRRTWKKFMEPYYCGDTTGNNLFGPLIDETSQQGITNGLAVGISSTVHYPGPVVSLISPTNFEDTSVTVGSSTFPLVLSGILLDGPNMNWEYAVNSGSYTPVSTTYNPANIPLSFVDTWTTAPISFAPYSGQTITLHVRGSSPNYQWTDGVNALTTFNIQLDIV